MENPISNNNIRTKLLNTKIFMSSREKSVINLKRSIVIYVIIFNICKAMVTL